MASFETQIEAVTGLDIDATSKPSQADVTIFLNHSILTPILNVGLITPNTIIKESLLYAEKNQTPINSTEGFIRQIIGWREFIRGIYECKGSYERTKNFWGFKRKIPLSFYKGNTGIYPIDQTIKKILKTGYCHHIERLMVLGNFMSGKTVFEKFSCGKTVFVLFAVNLFGSFWEIFQR